jgi:hypothetical protein
MWGVFDEGRAIPSSQRNTRGSSGRDGTGRAVFIEALHSRLYLTSSIACDHNGPSRLELLRRVSYIIYRCIFSIIFPFTGRQGTSMFSAIYFIALSALLPAQSGQLSLSGVRLTFGALGPVRAEAKLLPGDNLFAGFDIEGITVDDSGKVRYSTSLDLVDSKGKVLFHQEPKDQETINSLGGNTLPAFAQVDIGLETPPGMYTLKVKVTDLASKKSQELVQKFEVLAKDFGLVRLSGTADPDGQDPIAALGTGQTLWVHAAAVGFKREKASGQPNLTFELSVLDENGKTTLKKPFTGTVTKDVPAQINAVPVQFYLSLNRPGKFTVVMKVTDQISGMSQSLKYPLNVLSGGK